jgi:protein-L-isoaspartate(D-aspartate) O-methyltransferase
MQMIWRWARDIADGVRHLVGQDIKAMHRAMVDDLVNRKLITSPAVEAAFRAVPRHPFLPGVALDAVYKDDVVVTHYNAEKQPISSSSQPAMMAIMLEMLALAPGQRVLEIGAGTGYNAALIAHIVGAQGSVVAVDIDADVLHNAAEHLAAAGVTDVRLVLGDGALGCDAFAPYDRIILTVGAYDIVPDWRDQLVEGGLLILPLTLRATPRVFAFRRQGDSLIGVTATAGGFMPLRGAGAPQEYIYPLPTFGGMLWTDRAIPPDIPALEAQLALPYRDLPTGVQGGGMGRWSGEAIWIELRDPDYIQAPYTFERDGKPQLGHSVGLAADGKVALVVPGRERDELRVRAFGDGDALAERLIRVLQDWQAAGSPSFEDDVVVSAFPQTMAIKALPGSMRVVKPQMQFITTPKRRIV